MHLKRSFTHLNVSSAYSLRYASGMPEKIVEQAKLLNFSKIAITDQDTLSGAINFVQHCLANSITPIIGVDFNLGKSRVLVLARGKNGFRDLCHLVSKAHEKERGKPKLDISYLWEKMKQGNLVAILGVNSDIGQNIIRNRNDLALHLLNSWLEHVDKQDLIIEVVSHSNLHKVVDPKYSINSAAKMTTFARDNQLRAILTNATRYIKAEDAIVTELLESIETKKQLNFDQVRHFRGSAYLKSTQDMYQIAFNIGKYLSSIEVGQLLLKFSEEVANECSLDPARDLGIGSINVPETDLVLNETNSDSVKALYNKCQASLINLNLENKNIYQDRLKEELDVINGLNFSGYFLTVAEVVNLIKEKRIRVAARGSGAGSLVNYLLGISNLDPIKYGLVMERFLSPLRSALPDIDIDVESARRLEIYEAIYKRFGNERVACISMRETYRVRHAIRDVGAALGMPISEIDAFAKAFPRVSARKARKVLQQLPELNKSSFAKLFSQGNLDLYLDLVEKLDGLPRHLAMHPCGVILSDKSLLDRTPVEYSASGFAMSQFDKDDVELMGFLKLDVLGIRMQSAMAYSISEIKRVENLEVNLDEISLEDQKTFHLIQSTKTLGCFQIESPGQRELIGKFGPQSFNDLIIDISLFRPGPIKSDMITPFLEVRQKRKPYPFLHEKIDPILEETSGVVVFHEQVIKIISTMTGCSLALADEKRRSMSFEEGQNEVEEWFIEKSRKLKYSNDLIKYIWEVLKAFASFGFCKAHSAAFAFPTYQSAWLKTHHPAAFLAGVLTHDPGMYPKRLIANDAKNFGIELLGLDINKSDSSYRVEKINERYGIRLSLLDVKSISYEETERIIKNRPYKSLTDFWQRAQVSKDVTENIILAGGFDSLIPSNLNRRDLLLQLSDLEHNLGVISNQLVLDVSTIDKNIASGLPDFTKNENIVNELKVLGIDASSHLAESFIPFFKEFGVTPSKMLFSLTSGSEVFVAGVKVTTQTPPIRSGKRVIFLTLDDPTGPSDAAFFEDAQTSYAATIYNSLLLLVRGNLRKTGPRGISIKATGCWDLTQIHSMYQKYGIAEVKRFIDLSFKPRNNKYHYKSGGVSLEKRTLKDQKIGRI
ncbi:MAG: DNA polymerase III subunit alpha [Candidatus Nanopelagicales bacterium]